MSVNTTQKLNNLCRNDCREKSSEKCRIFLNIKYFYERRVWGRNSIHIDGNRLHKYVQKKTDTDSSAMVLRTYLWQNHADTML